MPFLPARPVRPERCCRVSASRGSSTWTTRRQIGQIDAARGDVGRDQHPRPPVAQRLQRLVAFVLAMLAGQGDGVEAALGEAGMEPADIVAGGAEQQRRIRLVQPQQIDHRMLDLGRRDGHRLIVDVAMAALLADRGDAQRVALVALGERHDRLGHGRREEQGAALRRRRVEYLLEILAKAHVEHLVGFVEHRGLELAEVERAALEMVAQPPRRADHDMGAVREAAALLRRRPCRRRRSRSAPRPCRRARSVRG